MTTLLPAPIHQFPYLDNPGLRYTNTNTIVMMDLIDNSIFTNYYMVDTVKVYTGYHIATHQAFLQNDITALGHFCVTVSIGYPDFAHFSVPINSTIMVGLIWHFKPTMEVFLYIFILF